jgi:tRNA (guanosine-2'-O-)-methyltransferase
MTPERKNRLEFVLNNRQNDLTVILENVFDPHNVSAVIRTCDAVGIMEIYVLNTIIPNHFRYNDYASSSASKWVMIHRYNNTEACFEAVRKKYKYIYSTHLNEGAKGLYELDLSQPTALVFGNERFGVSPELLKLCDGNFIIPQAGMIRSLNISVACAVSVYEAFRQKNLQQHYNQRKITSSEQQELLKLWDEERLENEI